MDTDQNFSNRTTILFLVDGLGLQTLEPYLDDDRLPNIKRHFLGVKRKLMKAHAAYPTLTFTNVSSLLREAPPHITGALGNKVVHKGRLIDFESLRDREKFGDVLKGKNIFTRLAEKGQRTVSLDYGLGVDATYRSELYDLKSGIALELEDYAYLDKKRISSLKLLLKQKKKVPWPDFIFVHLVGVDFLSHAYGPDSKKVTDYLLTLDRNLGEVFELIREKERTGYQVISILTADHGFSPSIHRVVDINKTISKLDKNLRVINEVRTALVYSTESPTLQDKESWAKKLVRSGEVELVSFRHGSQFRILSRNKEIRIDYQQGIQCSQKSMALRFADGRVVCPDGVLLPLRDLFYPYLIKNLAYFFQAEKYPDLLLIPHKNDSFAPVHGGYHGGPTVQETFIPLLMRNATLSNPQENPAIWEILKFL